MDGPRGYYAEWNNHEGNANQNRSETTVRASAVMLLKEQKTTRGREDVENLEPCAC